MPKPQPYAMNYNWIWGPDNPLLDKKASITMALEGSSPKHLQELLNGWLSQLSHDPVSGHYFQGGFSIKIHRHEPGSATIEFISGGQDVADSLSDAIDTFYEQVLQHLDGATVTWTENPLE